MRIRLLLSLALCCAAFAVPANAATADRPGTVTGQSVAPRCPPGSWWVPEGYQRKGKWKPSRDYYYEFHLFCPKCGTTYHVGSAKRFVDQPPSLF